MEALLLACKADVGRVRGLFFRRFCVLTAIVEIYASESEFSAEDPK